MDDMSFIRLTREDDGMSVDSLRLGDMRAFTAIYERYHRMLYVLAYKYLKDTSAAEDAVQQVFLKLWEARSLLVPDMNLRNYLYTMLKNHVLNEIRDNNLTVEKNYELAQASPEYEDELLDKLEEKDMMARLYEAIERLPEQKRQVCLYKLRGNLSNQDIADKMGISVPTVKTHYAQAIKMLRKHFEKLFMFLLYVVGSSLE